MNSSLKTSLICLLTGVAAATQAPAANTILAANFSAEAPGITYEADPYYNVATGLSGGVWDGISTVFHAPVVATEGNSGDVFTSSFYGRNYDADPCNAGGTGLLNRGTLTGETDAPWLLKHGLAPSAVGSLLTGTVISGKTHIVDSSYLGFNMCNKKGEVMFDSANLSITGFYNVDGDVQIWAATSADGFTHPVIPIIYQDGSDTDVYSFDFTDLAYMAQCLEIRVYGVIGLDQGTFNSSSMSAGVDIPINALPEPGLPLLLTLFGGVLILRRRREIANL